MGNAMAQSLVSLIDKLVYFLRLILREKHVQEGILLRSFLYLTITIFLVADITYLVLAFFLELSQLFLVSLLLPSKKYELSKLIWLNPIFCASAVIHPFSLVVPITLLLVYIAILRLSYLPLLFLVPAVAFASFQAAALIMTATYLLTLGYMKSIRLRARLVFVMLVVWEVAFFYDSSLTDTEQIFYRLILLGLFMISRTHQILAFQPLNLILYCLASIGLVLSSDPLYLAALTLIFYIFTSKENLSRISAEFILLNLFLGLCLAASYFYTDGLQLFMQQNMLVLCVALISIVYRFANFQTLNLSPYSVFLVSGDSGVGKDRFVSGLLTFLGVDSTNHISGDDFHKYERSSNAWSVLTHLNPLANSVDVKQKKIFQLLKGQTINHRHYEHGSGKFSSQFKVTPRFNLIISGLHAQYLKGFPAYRFHLSMDPQLNKLFKVKRDVYERSKSVAESLSQFESRRADAKRFIDGQESIADLNYNLSIVRPEFLDLFFDNLSSNSNIDVGVYDEVINDINDTLLWKISSQDTDFLERIFDFLVFHSLANLTKVALINQNILEISLDCDIPSLSDIRTHELKDGPYDFLVNCFESVSLNHQKMDVLSFVSLQFVLYKNKKGN